MKAGRCGTITGREYHLARNEPICEGCKRAYRRWQERYRLRVMAEGRLLIPSIGTHRRIQALQWMGWTMQQIADQIGITSGRAVNNLLTREHVHRDTAARIEQVYERLCSVPGPSGITRRRAMANGWASWAAWEDIDNPDDRPQTPQEERRKAWRDNRRRKSLARREREAAQQGVAA